MAKRSEKYPMTPEEQEWWNTRQPMGLLLEVRLDGKLVGHVYTEWPNAKYGRVTNENAQTQLYAEPLGDSRWQLCVWPDKPNLKGDSNE